jgi:hypothetical protein
MWVDICPYPCPSPTGEGLFFSKREWRLSLTPCLETRVRFFFIEVPAYIFNALLEISEGRLFLEVQASL